jgi:hypothetical protein
LKHAIEVQGSLPSGGIIEGILSSQRRALFEAFAAFRKDVADGTVLNVCMEAGPLLGDTDYLSAWSEDTERARQTSHAISLQALQPAPLRLPYADACFDWVFCNEVIEHAGNAERQAALVAELYRVARKGIFLTTPNRRHPIEFKTGRPLFHLLPARLWQQLLRWSGKGQWAQDGMLNLVDASALYGFASGLPGVPEHDVGHKRVFGIKAYFFLMISKRA